ncbi:MAG: CHAT domain-containing protein, partial [bacterium]
GRALLDMVSTRWGRELTGEELAKEQRLDNEIVRLSGILDVLAEKNESAVSVDVDLVHGVLLAAEAEWTTFQFELKRKYPLSEGQSYSLDKVQEVLGPDEGIVSWLETDGMSFVYVLDSEGPVAWVALEAENRPNDPRSLIDALSDPGREPGAWRVAAEEVFNRWLAPVQDKLFRLNHIYVIPSGSMAGIPVETLEIGDGELMIDRWEVSYIPSATVLVWLKGRDRPGAKPSLLALGDPPFNAEQASAMDGNLPGTELAAAGRVQEWDAIVRGASAGNRGAIDRLERLGGARREIETISALFDNSTILLGREASEGNLLRYVTSDTAADYRYLHFATHAFPHQTWGIKSSLILSQVDLPDAQLAALRGERILDGRLTMEEVMREWRIDADLVTLSACETALGQRARGEGYVGFAHAFFIAGARSVVVSLWKVADRPTRLLMERFYTNMVRKDMSKSKALREAKLWLRDLENLRGERPYRHPYYWSAFVLIGDAGD